ncbi:HtaA domain-containing protein [Herbiconiux sp.]|uniref:HtaA domain-containing protein n=1 Tax=Herbiconiux sp. TaxID=1871186 RepID=UPI0025BC544A|nr:HtaA domain-containing protein [Herbiconiux sp.]
MNTTRTPRRLRPLAGVLVGALVSGLAVVGIAAPASAATGDVTSATLDWGVKASWRGYVAGFGGTVTPSDGASTDPAYRWSTSGTGAYDEATGAASVSFGGAVEWKVPAHGIDIVLSDPELDLASDGTGTLSFDYVDPTGATGSGVFATLSTSGATVTHDGGVANYSGVAATAAAAMTAVFGGSYAVGTALDAVSFTLPYELAPVASATSTVLTASPSGTSALGAEVVFTASVSPAADGQVQFFDGGAALGDPVATTAGVAELRTSGLGVGDHSVTAEFTPADSSLYLGSTSEPVTQTVTDASGVPDAPTSTTLAVAPAAPVVAGTASSLTATVTSTEGTPTGSVEFFSIAAGQSARVSLGTAPVTNGIATLPATLSAGGHTFAAVFTATGAFEGSEAVTAANYGVVDTADAASCAPGTSARTVDGVSATWAYSAYSTDWVKSATGDIAVDGQDFVLSGGVASYDADCTVIEFSGSLRVLAYPTMGGFWIDLADPTLSIAADGTGTWSADVTTVSNATPQRLVVTTVSGADVDLSATGTADVALDYASATQQGTWSAAYGDAWSNGFVLNAPSSIRSFYYKSGETPGNLRKAPAAISLAWTVTEPEQPTEPSEGGDLVWGVKSSWRSYLAAFGGTTTASNGASVNADGLFVFTQADTGEYDATTGVGSIDYQGAVRFVNPSHGFDIAFANPTVTLDGTGSAVLSAETSTNDTAGLTSLSRVDLAVLDLPTPTGTDPITWSAVPATFEPVLQPDGWNQYAGQSADPVTFSYGSSVVPPVVQPTLSVTGLGTVAQGETLTVQGSGFEAGQLLGVVVHSEPVTLPSVEVPAGGAFTITWVVPADFEVGAHSLDVTGPDGTVSIGFTVTAATATVVSTGPDSATAPAAQPSCVAQTVTGATLNWGVKESFRSYIVGPIAKGSISTSGVADNGSSYGWSDGSGSVNAVDTLGRVSFSGSVHFTGHGGQLDLTVSNPRIQLSGPNSASLIADLSSKELSGGTVNVSAAIATLSLSAGGSSTSGGVLRWSDVPATLTAAGASAFGGFYSAGAALDPVSFSLPLGATTACDSSTDGALASTGRDTSGVAGEIVIALVLLLTGGAFLVARRRGTVRTQG